MPLPLRAPTTYQEAGLSPDLLMRLTLKMLHSAGELTGNDLAKRLGVLFAVLEPSLEFLKLQRHCEVVGGMMVGGASYRYRITTEGRAVTQQLLKQDQYVGPVPVPLAQYTSYMRTMHANTRSRVNRDVVRDAFSELVLSDKMLDEIGTAARGGRSIFIYGPPGNGKTVIAEGLQRLLYGDVAIPYAIEVEGIIIRVYDPVNHTIADDPDLFESEDKLTIEPAPVDGRWALCRRPIVKVGGELMLESLDLTYEPRLGYYRAPVQMIANGGVLIVDDFGRQRCSPADLLNRWMVPLENNVDFLTLQSGQKFEIPFTTFVAFATNVRPSDLVDEAFLRRVPFKVYAENPTREQFVTIFDSHVVRRHVSADPGLAEYLLDSFYRTHTITPRACHPRDLINQAILLADYRGVTRHLTQELLKTACANYFLEEGTEGSKKLDVRS
jgi:predicted ATPase with chaperone activity